MADINMDRSEFLRSAGRCCVGTWVGLVLGGLAGVRAEDVADTASETVAKPRSETRMEFAEKWVTRFMDVLDENLDKETCRKIMMANGRKCYRGWIEETGRKINQITLEQYADWIDKNVKDDSYRIEGNVIYFQFMAAAETGLPSEEGKCLCTFVETMPEGLSETYCDCSIGYVKEWHELLLGRPVEVEIIESVLKGNKRCKFKITVL